MMYYYHVRNISLTLFIRLEALYVSQIFVLLNKSSISQAHSYCGIEELTNDITNVCFESKWLTTHSDCLFLKQSTHEKLPCN